VQTSLALFRLTLVPNKHYNLLLNILLIKYFVHDVRRDACRPAVRIAAMWVKWM